MACAETATSPPIKLRICFFISSKLRLILTKIGKITQNQKKVGKIFGGNQEKPYLCIAFQGKHIMIGLWCNGSTTGFGSVCPGSNPGNPTQKRLTTLLVSLFCYTLYYS